MASRVINTASRLLQPSTRGVLAGALMPFDAKCYRITAITYQTTSRIHLSTGQHQTVDQTKPAATDNPTQRDLDKINNRDNLKHFKDVNVQTDDVLNTERGAIYSSTDEPPMGEYALPHRIWSYDELHSVKITHRPPHGIIDKLAYGAVQTLGRSCDIMTGFNRNIRDTDLWLTRVCFLETVAAVPGMVAAMVRHLQSLRVLTRDHGWIHTLLEEAENERMHLMTALQLKQPGILFRGAVMGTQGVFVAAFSVSYLLSPRFCHRFVGYLEEEAVITYTKLLKDIEQGAMQHWNKTPAPDIAIKYWQLPAEATMKDVILAIRADEAHHRVVNHSLASLSKDDHNPYKTGE
eukprot:GHVU01089260.1.p1 GENE.GHVU01089260.1~~GHVU01089260.1.p1  ORF type:complete len:349 (-),score=28.69 GHVU01089260.1:909-1955(-)